MHKLFLPFILISCALLHAQNGTFSGTLQFEDGTPIINAHVLIKTTGKYAITDFDGLFKIKKIAYGEHTVDISSIEVDKKTLSITIKSPLLRKIITLKRAHTELDEVTIEGKSKATQIETKGFAVNAIETKGIKLQSIQVIELLDQSTGIRLLQTGGMGSRIKYNINGLSGSSIRIFLDGIPISSYGSSFSLANIPSSMIERIEVYKGVVPAKLGNDALGGAINVIMNKAASNSLNASYSFGSFNTHRTSINGNYRNSKSGFTVSGSIFRNYSDNNYKVWGDVIYITPKQDLVPKYITAERFHDTYKSKGIKLDVGFSDLKWVDNIFIGVVASDIDKEIQHGASMERVYGNRRGEQATKMINGSFNKADFLIKGLDLNLFVSHSKLTRKIIDTIPLKYDWSGNIEEDFYDIDDFRDDKWNRHKSGAEAGQPTLNESLENNNVGRINTIYNINDNHRIGANYIATNFSRDPDDAAREQYVRDLMDIRSVNKKILGVTYEADAFDKKLKTSFFFKYFDQTVNLKDFVRRNKKIFPFSFSKQMNESGYGLALSYSITPKIQIMTSAETAIRLPVNHELFGNLTENILAAHELNPERSKNANFGINLGPFFIQKHRFQLNTNFFYRDTEGKIKRVIEGKGGNDAMQYENVDAILSTGMDADLNYSYMDKLTFVVGMSIFNSRFNRQYDEDGNEFSHFGDRERNAPFFTLNSNLKYNLTDLFKKGSRTSFYYNVSFVEAFFQDWESLGSSGKNVIPSQLINSLGASHTFPSKKITLSFDLKNILNEQVFDNYALQRPGKAFYIKLNYSIN